MVFTNDEGDIFRETHLLVHMVLVLLLLSIQLTTWLLWSPIYLDVKVDTSIAYSLALEITNTTNQKQILSKGPLFLKRSSNFAAKIEKFGRDSK